MATRPAQLLSLVCLILYLVLAGVGLYLQINTGIYAYGGTVGSSIIFLGAPLLAVWIGFGILIIWHYPNNSIGWIMCLWPVSWAIDQFSSGYQSLSATSFSGTLPGTEIALVWQNWSIGAPFALLFLTLLFLLFPTGYPQSPRWKIGLILALFFNIIYMGLEAIQPGPIFPPAYVQLPDNPLGAPAGVWRILEPLWTTALIGSVAMFIASCYSLFSRYLNSKSEGRQQIKWFVYFAAFLLVGMLSAYLFDFGFASPFLLTFGVVTAMVGLVGMAVAIAIAIFKYQLYAIDIIIRRTLVYGFLTGFLVLLYFSIVTILQGLLAAVSNQQQPAVIVLSTLIIAALFNPLRSWIQDNIDRGFYRKKYDAEHALRLFNFKVRDEVDIDILSNSLLEVVSDTFQPHHSSIWIIDPTPPDGFQNSG